MVFMIYSLNNLVMTLNFLLLIFLSHRYFIIHLLISWNFYKLCRQLNPSWWLCQVLAVMTPVPTMIKIVFYIPRILVIWLCILEIHLHLNVFTLHLFCMILCLNYWRNQSWQDLLWKVSFPLSKYVFQFQFFCVCFHFFNGNICIVLSFLCVVLEYLSWYAFPHPYR